MAGAGEVAASGLHTLYTFCQKFSCGDGRDVVSALTMDTSGNLYGTTREGGVRNSGTVFEVIIRPSGIRGHLKTLYNFCALSNCADGTTSGGLILDAAGNLYGTTYNGGTADAGTVFRLTPNAQRTKWRLETLYSFCSRDSFCSDGIQPIGALTYAGAQTGVLYDGTSPLYGVTEAGGKGSAGVAFSLIPRQGGSWSLKVIHVFCSEANCADGGVPAADLTIDASGNLYGGTQSSVGEIFELSPSGANKWSLSVLYRFCQQSGCSDGAGPNGGLARDASGTLFGTTRFGGHDFNGVVFKLTGDGTETVLHAFCTQKNCRDGESPDSGVILDEAGNLFGTTPEGGSRRDGIVYEVSDSLHVLHRFCIHSGCTDGTNPVAALIMDGAGNLFGTTTGGGLGGGTVFKLVP